MQLGQHRGVYVLGKHQGKYLALKQDRPIPFWRVAPEFWDDTPAMNAMEGLNLPTETSVIGANIHRASETVRSARVGRWSAACQVLADSIHFRFVIDVCQAAVKVGLPNRFSYTLITEEGVG